jgi:hypothetical protein
MDLRLEPSVRNGSINCGPLFLERSRGLFRKIFGYWGSWRRFIGSVVPCSARHDRSCDPVALRY